MVIAVFLSGVVAVISQSLFIRELLAFFSGNELLSGMILFLWLLSTGIGSLAYSKLRRQAQGKNDYPYLLLSSAGALTFAFFFIRYTPKIFALSFGELISFDRIIIISVLSLFPIGLIFGALFPAASALLKPSKVYLFESLGSFLGGVILTFVLVSIIPPSGIILLLLALLFMGSFLCSKKRVLLILSLLPLCLLPMVKKIEHHFKSFQLIGMHLLGVYESRYGNIVVTESASQINFYSNGVFDFAYPDKFSAEEAVHYSLLLHENPQEVLLVGGGLGGAIEEVLKHSTVQKLVYVELDPQLIKLAFEYLRKLEHSDPRLELVNTDGRFFMKKSRAHFDCIIINLPDPVNIQLNRYYTQEFFQEARRILKPNGIFSIRLSCPPDILSPDYRQLLGTIKRTLQSVFNHVLILPVAKANYIAREQRFTKEIKEVLKENFIHRNLSLQYVNPDFFDYTLTLERIEYVNNSVDQAPAYFNTDLKPVCYYFNTLLWSNIASEWLKRFLVKSFYIPTGFYFLLLIPIFFFLRRKTLIPLSVFITGAGNIASEIVLLIIFQSLHGYLYHWVGLMIGAFMLGLAMGTLFYVTGPAKILDNLPQKKRFLTYLQFAMGGYFSLIFGLVFVKIFIPNYLIVILIFSGGVLGGIHFPLALEIWGTKPVGLLYGIDLFGASLGALLMTTIFIPILGIPLTNLIFILMHIIMGIGLATVQ
ncbi:MAG: methyltransferase [candidate division WOR-3 bacterium]